MKTKQLHVSYRLATISLLCLALLGISNMVLAAEMPANYYAQIEGKKDSLLKDALYQTIKGGERYKYGSQSDNSVNLYTWNAFCLTDARPDGTIWDMYSPYTHHFTYHNRSVSGMAIEHSFPKSWWGWGITKDETNFAYRDLYHLNPSEHRANGKKSDAMPGVPDSIVELDNGIFKVGFMKGQPYKRVFEPADCYKGDFARAYLYIVTCYADYNWIDTAVVTKTGKISKDTSGAYFAMTNNSYLAFQPWLQKLLMQWHRLDPVSEKEILRQDIISTIQKNRNPYIDYPELAEYIWGNKAGQVPNLNELTFTGSADYIPPFDTQHSVALPATNATTKGFTAHWKNAGAEKYTLNIFTQDTTGTPDTLINMPGLKASWINANEYLTWNGTTGTSDGDAGITLGSKEKDYTITISGITIPTNTVLVVRANISKYENVEASLKITSDGKELQTIKLNFNETYYTIPMPEGNHAIVLSQGISLKRVCMQQLFLIQNPQVITRNTLHTQEVTIAEADKQLPIINYPLSIDKPLPTQFYYSVTAEGLKESQPISVYNDGTTTLCPLQTETYRLMQEGNHVTINQLPATTLLSLIDISGRTLWQTTVNDHYSFLLPTNGLYILKVNNNTYKLITR